MRLVSAVMFVACLAAACDGGSPAETVVPPAAQAAAAASSPTPAAASAAPAERAKITYLAIGPQAEEMGLLTVILPATPGGRRTFSFGLGEVVEADLTGVADITKPIGSTTMAAALGVTDVALKNAGDPRTYLLTVLQETPPANGSKLCGDSSPTFLLLRQLETPQDKTMTLVFLSAQPGDPAAKICRKLVYTAR